MSLKDPVIIDLFDPYSSSRFLTKTGRLAGQSSPRLISSVSDLKTR